MSIQENFTKASSTEDLIRVNNEYMVKIEQQFNEIDQQIHEINAVLRASLEMNNA